MCACVHVDQNSDYLPHRGEAPGPVKNGVNFSSYGKAKNSLSMATERVLKGGNTEHAISDPLFVQALTHTLRHKTTTYVQGWINFITYLLTQTHLERTHNSTNSFPLGSRFDPSHRQKSVAATYVPVNSVLVQWRTNETR